MPELYLPTVPAPAFMIPKTITRASKSQAESGKFYSRKKGSSLYEFKVVYPPMLKSDFVPINVFLNGLSENDIFRMYVDKDLSGETGLRVGNLANFNNDTKLHLIESISPLSVKPPARVSGGSLDASAPYIRCHRKGKVHEVKLNNLDHVRYEFDVVERI